MPNEKFSFLLPPINVMSGTQKPAIERPIKNNEALIITGCPGSGKTTVVNYRAKNCQLKNDEFIFMVWTKLLAKFIQNISQLLEVPTNKIVTRDKWYYWKFKDTKYRGYKPFIRDNWGDRSIKIDEIRDNFINHRNIYKQMIIDEAQDLEPEFIKLLPILCEQLTICCDNAQDVFAEDSNADKYQEYVDVLTEIGMDIVPIMLDENFRNTKEIYQFAKEFVSDIPMTQINAFRRSSTNDKPTILVSNDRGTMSNKIKNIINSSSGENVGILCQYIDEVNQISYFLKETAKIKHSIYHSRLDWRRQKDELDSLKNVVVCTQQSAKGLEFETVIMPYIEGYSPEGINKKKYYVSCTRAKNRLYLLSSEDNIQFIKNIIPQQYYDIK